MSKSLYAIYFPQFYAIECNNEAWGHQFTDWLLIGQANFENAWSRRVPQRGFYNGADTQVQSDQITQALNSGLDGFALYHYWFYPKRELHHFEDGILGGLHLQKRQSWFLIWANEHWTKRWVGDPSVLIELTREPSRDQVIEHCRHLMKCFEQPGYLRWRGKPLFVFYNLGYFSQPEKVIYQYRTAIAQLGGDVHIAQAIKSVIDLKHCGFVDANYVFEPRSFFNSLRTDRSGWHKSLFDTIVRILGESFAQRLMVFLDRRQQLGVVHEKEQFVSYWNSQARHELLAAAGLNVQNILCPAWNNAPRYRQRFTSLEDLDESFFLQQLIQSSQQSDLPVIINAWNEWSEGAAIEPCTYQGSRYLEVIKNFSASASKDTENA
jgi:hypothetical protein